MPDIRRSSLLDPVKIGSRPCRPNSVNRTSVPSLMFFTDLLALQEPTAITSGAKALNLATAFGTAEAVRFPKHLEESK